MRVSRFAKHTSQSVREEQGGCARPCRLYMEVIQIMRAGLDPGTKGGAEKSLAGSLRGSSPVKSAHTQGAHILEHTVRAEELSCSSVPDALSTLCFFARVLLHSFFFVCLFGWFFFNYKSHNISRWSWVRGYRVFVSDFFAHIWNIFPD